MAGYLTALSEVPKIEEAALKAVEKSVGYQFTDRTMLIRALTHASYQQVGAKDLERLEFLGDRVLGLFAAEALWRRYPELDEGGLAPRLNALVRKETCAEAAKHWDLGASLRMSVGEEKTGGRQKTAILGDACEALLGALYIDGGLQPAQAAFDSFWGERLEQLVEGHRDPKTALQEWAQDKGFGTPRYVEIAREGPDHAPLFTIAVEVGTLPKEDARGTSKQAAQMQAAEALLRREGVW